MDKKLISLVIPAYKEWASLAQFFSELNQELAKLSTYDFEIIFVNDGSTDNTWEEIVKITNDNSFVRWLDLSRNFGKEVALTAWLETAKGEAVITLDADWQHPVTKLVDFLAEREQWYHIVYNQRPTIAWASFFKKVSSTLFYKFFNAISDFKLEPGTTDYRLLDRVVVDQYLKFWERNRLYRWLIDRMWYTKKALVFDAQERIGEDWASYTFSKLMRLAMDSVTSFSIFPLKLVWYLGLMVMIIAVVMIMYMWIDIIFMDNSRSFNNTTFLVIFSIFLSGITLSSLGLIALYIANIHEEVMERPLYIVKEKI